MDLRKQITKIQQGVVTSQDQKDCNKCNKYFKRIKTKKTQSIIPPDLGRKYCGKCKVNYCKKIPDSEICKLLLPLINQDEMNELTEKVEKTRIQVPKLKVPQDERCMICRKHVIGIKKSKDVNEPYLLGEEQTIEMGQSCIKCKAACKDIQSELEGDVNFCKYVDELLLYYKEFLLKRKANK